MQALVEESARRRKDSKALWKKREAHMRWSCGVMASLREEAEAEAAEAAENSIAARIKLRRGGRRADEAAEEAADEAAAEVEAEEVSSIANRTKLRRRK